MTAWAPPAEIASYLFTATDSLRMIFLEQLPNNVSYDAITMATPLDTVKTQLGLGKPIAEIIREPVFGLFAGKAWEWISASYLLGGLWLIQQRIVAWQIPLALLLSLALFSGICYFIDSQQFTSPLFHLFSGATMLGAFFIASDPVTASTTPTGRLIYGAMIGVLIYIIRVWGGYPDAIAFAVLLMNLAAPTIDYYTRPKVFGER
jgi:electron transport complex protein RnfD